MKNTILIALLMVTLVSNAQIDSTKSEIVTIPDTMTKETFRTVQQMPQFPGGDTAMYRFIAENLDYPPKAVKKNIQGRVHVQFRVLATGEITDIRTLDIKKLGYGLEEAAIDVIKKMPKWIPGKQNGVAVNVYFNLPIRFRLF